MTKDEILKRVPRWLDGMADGSIPFTVDERWDDVYAGNVSCHLTGKNVTVVIFNDCDELDYIDSVVRGGKTLDYNDFPREMTNYLRGHPTLLRALKSAGPETTNAPD